MPIVPRCHLSATIAAEELTEPTIPVGLPTPRCNAPCPDPEGSWWIVDRPLDLGTAVNDVIARHRDLNLPLLACNQEHAEIALGG